MTNNTELLTIQEVLQILKIGRTTFNLLRKYRKIGGEVKIGYRTIRFKKSEIEKFIQNETVQLPKIEIHRRKPVKLSKDWD